MIKRKLFLVEEKRNVLMGRGTIEYKGISTMHVYSFYLDGILIDTGAKSLEREFLSFFKPLPIEQVVITHHHEDHTGNAHFLQNERNVPIYMHDKMIEYCSKPADYPLYRKVFWGNRPPFHAESIFKNGSNSENQQMFSSKNYTWDVIETPGHAIDHIALLNRETGQLFSGDLFCQVKTKVVLKEESVPTIIRSIQKVLTYDFDEVFCCHAGFIKDGRSAFKRKLEYLLDLQGQVLDLYNKGMTPKEIQKTVFPKKYPITLVSFGEWESINIIHSIIQEHTIEQ